MSEQDRLKQAAAEAAADLVEDGMRLGLGSGSTSLAFVRVLGERVRNGLSLPPAVASSHATAEAARAAGIALCDMHDASAPRALDLTIDGADEVDAALRLIKGGGAALLREKIVAQMAKRVIIIVDESKLVDTLGAFSLPVEVVQYGWAVTAQRIEAATGTEPSVRHTRDGAPLVTDNGNLLLDLALREIGDPEGMAASLSSIAGVVEHGLFLSEADEVIIAAADGVTRRKR